MDTISSTWELPIRIGSCTPTFQSSYFADIENKIQTECSNRGLEGKFNVGMQMGGIPPIGDRTEIVNPVIGAICYHDVLGGILINTRNAEVNCRHIDMVMHITDVTEADPITQQWLANVSDKYVMQPSNLELTHIVFLPGSNMYGIVNHDRVHEILLDFPTAMVKPHPIQTPAGLERLVQLYGSRLLDKDISAMDLLPSCSMAWTTWNSEMGMLMALRRQQFGHVTQWRNAFECIYASIYRHMKYRDVQHNYTVMQKMVVSPVSGFIAPWMPDWEARVEAYFDDICAIRPVGTQYPYVNNSTK